MQLRAQSLETKHNQAVGTPTPASNVLHPVRESHPLRRLRPFGCPALDDSAGQAPLTPPSPQQSALRGEWRGEGGTLRPAQRAYAAPLPHFRGQRQCQLAALEDQSGGTLRCRSATARCRAPTPRASRSPKRLRGATEARCVGAPCGQSAGQHSSPTGYLADSVASATPPQRTIEPLRFRRPGPRLHPERTARPRGPGHEASSKDRRASVQLFTRPSLASSLGRA